MFIYGKDMLCLGIAVIIAAAVIAAVFFTAYFIGSSKLKKKLEAEYGKKE